MKRVFYTFTAFHASWDTLIEGENIDPWAEKKRKFRA